MSLYDSASLVMIPSGVKEDKLFSIKPTDGSGDFTFSRGSDIQATRVNASGLIEKAKVNLLTWSNNYDNWTKTNATATSGQSGYDGSSDAWLLTSTGTGNNTRRDVSYSGVSSFSVYAKAGTADGIRLRFDAATDRNLFVDLTDGSVITGVTTAFAYSVEPVGATGWYRVTATADLDTGINVRILVVDGTGAGTTGTIYIQDAQLNHGLIAQDYVETTTTAVVEGLTADLPRLDYSGGASCPSLKLEPSRTNLIPQSEYFGASSWVKLGAGTGDAPIVTENYAVSPEGVQNATRVQLDLNGGTGSSSNQSLFYDDLGTQTGDYTRSVYIKSLTTDTDLYFGGTLTDFELITATTEWQRFDFKSTLSASSLFATIGLRGTTGSSDSADILVYGFQAESGSYPTSYIPTYGTAAVRNGEIGVTSTTALHSTGVGTFFYDFKRLGIDAAATGGGFQLYSSTNAEQIRLHFDAPSAQVRWRDALNSYSNVGGIITANVDQRIKTAIVVGASTMKVFVNGAQIGSDYTLTATHDFDELRMLQRGALEANQALVFPTALTDAECISLTTI